MWYTVKMIEEDLDFGCEERSADDPVKAIVHLIAEDGSENISRMEDALLYQRDIKEGDRVSFDKNQKLEKVIDRQIKE